MFAMTALQMLRRQFDFDQWANHEIVVALRQGGAGSDRARQLFAHLLSAEMLWYSRIKGMPQRFPVSPDFTLDECDRLSKEIYSLWANYLVQELQEDSLASEVHYRNTKGEKHTSTVADILQHVILHGVYHRGQIAREMRSKGMTPAYTDFIHPTRCHLI
jgi:uncharacterized damage-inducible protein DinB